MRVFSREQVMRIEFVIQITTSKKIGTNAMIRFAEAQT